jgi:hypothetical protein
VKDGEEAMEEVSYRSRKLYLWGKLPLQGGRKAWLALNGAGSSALASWHGSLAASK